MSRLQLTLIITLGLIAIIVIGVSLGFPAPDPIAADNFDFYANGSALTGNFGLFDWGRPGANPWTATRFGVTCSGLPANCEITRTIKDSEAFVKRPFNNPKRTQELFVSYDVRVGPDTANELAVQQNDVVSLALTYGVDFPVLVVGKQAGSNDIKVGLGGFASSGIRLQPNKKFRIVACYDIDQKLISVWVNPGTTAFYNASTGESDANARLTNVPGLENAAFVTIAASRPGYFFDNLVIADAANAEGIGLRRR